MDGNARFDDNPAAGQGADCTPQRTDGSGATPRRSGDTTPPNSQRRLREKPSERSLHYDATTSPFYATGPPKTRVQKEFIKFKSHFNYRDLKKVLKCVLPVWVMSFFIFVSPLDRAYDHLAFIGCILFFLIPPEGIVLMNLLSGLTIILGLGLGWGWGVITMKAALAARPAEETDARFALLQEEARLRASAPGADRDVTYYAEKLITSGFMLDTRISAVYYCMVLAFMYFMARVRSWNNKLVLLTMFSWIVSDVFLSVAPSLPFFSGDIAWQFVKPTMTFVALGALFNLFLFPRSTSYITMEAMIDLLTPMQGFYDACAYAIRQRSNALSLDHLQDIRNEAVEAYRKFEDCLAFLPFDITIGRWNPEDILALKTAMRSVLITFSDFLNFQAHRLQARQRIKAMHKIEGPTPKNVRNSLVSQGTATSLRTAQLPNALLNVWQMLQDDDADELLSKSTAAFLNAGMEDLLIGCEDAQKAILDAFHHINERRWWNRPSVAECEEIWQVHEEILHDLQDAIRRCDSSTITGLLESSHLHFTEDGFLKHDETESINPVHTLFLGLVIEERALTTARSLEKALSMVIRLEQERTRTRVWFPSNVHRFATWAFGATPVPTVISDSKPTDAEDDRRKRESLLLDYVRTYEPAISLADLDAIRVRPGRKRRRIDQIIINTVNWIFNEHGMFAIRLVFGTLGVCIPAVLPASAGWYYNQKAVWAAVMMQTSLIYHTSEFFLNYIEKLAGTVIGGCFGMACWYIAGGWDIGNPYGMSAVVFVFSCFAMYGRLFTPHAIQQGIALGAATCLLIIGYSWTNTHVSEDASLGKGWDLWWRRSILVAIGLSIGVFVMFFPRPPSASRHFRSRMSGTLSSVKDLYVFWKRKADVAARLGAPEKLMGLGELAAREALSSMNSLDMINHELPHLVLEFSRTPYSRRDLAWILRLCAELNLSILQLLHYYEIAPDELRHRFVLTTGALDDDAVGDIMAVLTLAQHTLETAEPLPAILPGPLLPKFVEMVSLKDGMGMGDESLHRDIIVSEGFRMYCILLSSYVEILVATDELVFALKSITGESHILTA